MAVGVGNHAELPYVLYQLWDTTSDEYAGLKPIDAFVLWVLLEDVWQGKNGMLELPVSKAVKYGITPESRRASLDRLMQAGVILRMARQQGSNPEQYAVHFWPLSTKPEMRAKADAFREWANKERVKYHRDFNDIPEYYKLIP